MWHVAFSSKRLQTTERGPPFLWAGLDAPFFKTHRLPSLCPHSYHELQTFRQEDRLHTRMLPLILSSCSYLTGHRRHHRPLPILKHR